MSRILFALLILLTAMSAGLAHAQDRAQDHSLAGFGYSEADPEGDVWTPPPGVRIVTPIRGYSMFDGGDCPLEPDKVQGSGALVQLCLGFTYSPPPGLSQQLPITIEIPAGLTFISDDINTQNGILIRKTRVRITPGQTIFIPMSLMCMNSGRSSAVGLMFGFRMGPITRNAAFHQFFRMLETKQVPAVTTGETDGMQIARLQAAVWNLSEGDPLSAGDRAAIAALPDL